MIVEEEEEEEADKSSSPAISLGSSFANGE